MVAGGSTLHYAFRTDSCRSRSKPIVRHAEILSSVVAGSPIRLPDRHFPHSDSDSGSAGLGILFMKLLSSRQRLTDRSCVRRIPPRAEASPGGRCGRCAERRGDTSCAPRRAGSRDQGLSGGAGAGSTRSGHGRPIRAASTRPSGVRRGSVSSRTAWSCPAVTSTQPA